MRLSAASLLFALALAACNRGAEQRNEAMTPAAKAKAARAAAQAITPMPQRVAVLGVLNKRNGIVRTVALHPGQSARWKDMMVHLRACETSAPWEAEPLTGAFVQLDTQGRDKRWRRIFSGWLYKESPSLNVVEHPIYDVWPKSCAMKHPDIGADTVLASSIGSGAPRSIAKKSPDKAGDAADPAAAATPAPKASSNSTL